MERVWMLWHVHEWDDGHEDVKLIGVFASEEEAKSARAIVQDQPGFRDLPEGFSIDEAALGQIGWIEGYATLQGGHSMCPSDRR
jgi:hypothetical protein